jgi:hypothetical protein
MKCLLIREYDVYAHDLHHMVKDFKPYMQHGVSASMVGPYGHHPNRCIYIIHKDNKWYDFLALRQVGLPHEFSDAVLETNNWL